MVEQAYGVLGQFLENGELVAAADPDPARRQAAQDAGVGELYEDYEEMLARAPIDAVLIATPTPLHRRHGVAAARAGKHIFCEKPMARTVIEAARESNVLPKYCETQIGSQIASVGHFCQLGCGGQEVTLATT